MHLRFFNNKYLWPHGYSNRNLTTAVNSTNPKTEILSKIIEMQIFQIQIDFLFF